MIKILVTGGAGNIASALIAKLASNPANHIVIADNLLTGEITERVATPDEIDGNAVWIVELSDGAKVATFSIEQATGEILSVEVK